MMNSPPTQVPPTSVLYKLDKVAYSTPPPVSSDPANNECKLIEYRGAKVASFTIAGDVMICLPQAFDLFLRHLVGGLHTVYTKLKRLNIIPVVCNVEQVRILRGLGAIQPGVNRCKLLTRKEFDILYEDCTTASRPGRPPKRSLPMSLSQTVHMLHGLGHGDPLKKPKIENGLAGLKAPLPFNGYDSLMAGASPYLLTTHPALVSSGSYPGHHISSPSIYTNGSFIGGAASLQNSLGSPNSKSSSGGSGDHPGTDNESISPRTDHSSGGGGGGPGSRELASPPVDSDFNGEEKEVDRKHQQAMAAMEQSLAAHARDDVPTNSPTGHTNNHSKTSHMNGLLAVDVSSSRSSSHCQDSPERERSVQPSSHSTPHPHPHPHPHLHHNPHSLSNSLGLSLDHSTASAAAKEMFPPQGPSSIETLLTNIQGLLKVAADNARQQEKHINLERAELRLELLREREMRESLEKQLMGEQKRLAIILKRLKKEKKARRRLQEQLELSHSKRHSVSGETEAAAIARQNSTESLRALNGECADSLSHELEKERMARSESDKKSAASDSSPMSFSPPPPTQPQFQQDQAYYRWQEVEDGRMKRLDY
ncbi:dachshund homolog 1-like isoform X4 [Acanthaster planci]|uniref:Dachshund homolog 1-like isoform X4 n=1 Tax=Acanthaster planci TaxID=133434 RepID=A0A8B7Z5Q5_ACAPL|nr:dachshund homolog 1-like isoform X4 [Acanthaster planci]